MKGLDVARGKAERRFRQARRTTSWPATVAEPEVGLTSQNEDYLELVADGHMLRFPAVWLRDNCPCAGCLDPVSGQKLQDITELRKADEQAEEAAHVG